MFLLFDERPGAEERHGAAESVAHGRDGGTRQRSHRLLWSSAIFLLALLLGCQPLQSGAAESPALGARTTSVMPVSMGLDHPIFSNEPLLSLRGDPGFDPEELDEGERRWFELLWTAIENDDQYPSAKALASSDDEYDFARLLYEHNQALLLGLRATGDLRFLDRVDGLAQRMRDSLEDRWCGKVGKRAELAGYSNLKARDGFLNFRRRLDSDPVHYCRDISDLEESLMHGHLAMLMYAYHVNRDLESPAGIDYGERADFWLDYLRNHFEAKWRTRSGVDFPGMDFIDLKFCHTYSTFLLYYYYVGKRLQSEGAPAAAAYLSKAVAMTDALFETPYRRGRKAGGFIPTETPLGEAVVYSFGMPGRGKVNETHLEACPTTYARLAVTSMLQLRLESFHRWDDSIMRLLATGIAHFVADSDDIGRDSNAFAAGVSGTKTVEGIPPTTYRDRLTTGQFALSTFPALIAWEPSGRLAQVSAAVYEAVEEDPRKPRRVFIPAAMLLVQTLGSPGPEGGTGDAAGIEELLDEMVEQDEAAEGGDG